MSKVKMPEALAPFGAEQGGEFLSGLLADYSRLLGETGDLERLKHRVEKCRDLSIIHLVGDLVLVVACDSNAGCGEKPKDFYRWPYKEAVASMFKVTMMEMLASGATPVCVINNLCVEMEPTGKKIIEFMRQEMLACGMNPDTQLTGSTEDNAVTCQTGVGMTIIGLGLYSTLRLGKTRKGDTVVCIGNPKCGPQNPYRETDPDIATVAVMQQLCKLPYIHEILPCGSHGVRYEALELARYVGCEFSPTQAELPIAMDSSAGASTGVIVSICADEADNLRSAFDAALPVTIIGTIQ